MREHRVAFDQALTDLERQLETLRAELARRSEALATAASQRDRAGQALTERERQLDALRAELTRRSETFAAQRDHAGAAIAERERQLAALQAEYAQHFAALSAELSNREWRLGLLEAELQGVNAELQRVYGSRSWRMAERLRLVMERLREGRDRLRRPWTLPMVFLPSPLRERISAWGKARLVRASGLFDTAYYLEQNPDVASAGVDPLLHYLLSGAAEGRDPGPNFDSSFYVEHHPDVRAAGMNPLVHYLLVGKAEGSASRPASRTRQAATPPVAIAESGATNIRGETPAAASAGVAPDLAPHVADVVPNESLGAAVESILASIPGSLSATGRMLMPRVREAIVAHAGRMPGGLDELARKIEDIRAARLALQQDQPRQHLLQSAGKRLRILAVAAVFPSVEHGDGLRLFDMLRWLSRRHDVYLYAPYRAEIDETSMRLLRERLHGIRIVDWTLYVQKSPAPDLERWLRVSHIRLDVALFASPDTVSLMSTVRPFTRTIVFDLIESTTRRAWIDLLHAATGQGTPIAQLALQLWDGFHMEQLALRRSELALAATADDLEFARRAFHPKRAVVVPTMVSDYAIWERVLDAQGSPLSDPGGEPGTAIFLASDEGDTDEDALRWILAEVRPLVLKRLPTFRVLIAGPGRLDGFHAEFRRDPSVEFLGRMGDLVPTLRRAKVCMSPLISGTGGQGKINQYSAVGRPTVATDSSLGGLPYENGVSILKADTPAQFADAIVGLLTDDKLYARIREGAWRIVNEHCRWDATLTDLETHLHDL